MLSREGGGRSNGTGRCSPCACTTCRTISGPFRCCCNSGATTMPSFCGRTTRKGAILSAMQYAARDCPICGSAKRRVFFHQEFAAVDQATPVTGYDVVVCGQCGGGDADGIPDQDAFDRQYRDMSKYAYAQRGGAESCYGSRRLAPIP